MLNEDIKHLKSELEFYKLKVLEQGNNKNIKDHMKISSSNIDQ